MNNKTKKYFLLSNDQIVVTTDQAISDIVFVDTVDDVRAIIMTDNNKPPALIGIRRLVFARRLLDVRKQRNLGQEVLSKRIREETGVKISGQLISKYENARLMPTISGLKAICRVLNVSADYLLGSTSQKKINLSTGNVCFSDRLAQLVSKQKLTQNAVREKMIVQYSGQRNVGGQYLRNLLKNGEVACISTLPELSKILGVSVDYLIGLTDQ